MMTLAERVKDQLTKQIKWYEHILEILGDFEKHLSEDALAKTVDRVQRDLRETERLDKRIRRLAEQWKKATDISDTDRVEVRDLSRRVKALAKEVIKAHQQADQVVRKQSLSIAREIGTLRTGRGAINKYRPGLVNDPGYVDKKA